MQTLVTKLGYKCVLRNTSFSILENKLELILKRTS